jgi:hypothetical protein
VELEDVAELVVSLIKIPSVNGETVVIDGGSRRLRERAS